MESQNELISGSTFNLNIYDKNNAGWFHLSVFDASNNSNPPAAPSDATGYYPITSKTIFKIILPTTASICELTPRFTVFRQIDGTPSRGFWNIEFEITCIDSRLKEFPVTPRYQITARNYYDTLMKDSHGNDGFNIWAINNFSTAQQISDMLEKNTQLYNAFKTKTGR